MIDNYNDPAGPMTEIDQEILKLKKLLRPASKTEFRDVIGACQSIRRNLSFIEDWAFMKGKENV